LLTWSTSSVFRQAVYRLGALSHLSPVTDNYGYNSLVSSPESSVQDLMLQTTVVWSEIPDVIAVRIPVDGQVFELRLDPMNHNAALFADDRDRPVRQASVDLPDSADRVTLEVSNFDHRVLVAIDGVPIFPALDIAWSDGDALQAQQNSGLPTFDGGSSEAAKTAEFVSRQNRLAI